MNLNVEYIFRALDKMTPVVKKMSRNFITSMKDMAFAVKYYTSPSGGLNFKNFSSNLKGLGKDIKKFGEKIKWLSAAAGVGTWKMLKESMNFEESQIMFETLLSSTEKGKKLMGEIDTLSKKTLMGDKLLRESAQTMLAYGMNAEKVVPLLGMLGDISAGNSEKFKVLAYNLSQIKSVGKLTAIDLKSLTLAGFNPLQNISEKTGYSMENLKEIMSKGGISFAMVEKAMKNVTSEGGRFFKLLEKRNKSASGALREFRYTFNLVARGLGDDLKPAFASVLRKMTSFLNWFKNASPWIRKLVAWTITLTAVLAPLTIALGGLIFAIGLLVSPIGFIIGGVALVVAGFIYWKEIILGLDNLIKSFIEDLKTVGEWMSKAMFWKKDLGDNELLEINKNIKGVGGENKIDIKNLLTIENKNNSEINYTPMPVFGAGKSMAY